MKNYAPVGTVKAESMSKKDAFHLGLLSEKDSVCFNEPEEEYEDEHGFVVELAKGCRIWMTKKAFNEKFKIAENKLDRVKTEQEDLSEKIKRLEAFTEMGGFKELHKSHQAMLYVQLGLMREYLHVLNLRKDDMVSEDSLAPDSLSFGGAIHLMEAGFCVRRKGWNGKGLVVFKKIPTRIEGDVVQDMQSIPESAKEIVLDKKKFIDYTSQCVIYNTNTGRADSWVASISDVFAKDWELVL